MHSETLIPHPEPQPDEFFKNLEPLSPEELDLFRETGTWDIPIQGIVQLSGTHLKKRNRKPTYLKKTSKGEVVFCTVSDSEDAQDIIDELNHAGVEPESVSVLFAKKNNLKSFVREKHSKAAEFAIFGGTIGCLLGGIIGFLIALRIFTLPWISPFALVEPILVVLSGMASLGILSAILGALIGLGFPKIELKKYESKLEKGDLFISVETVNEEESHYIKGLFQNHHARNIHNAASVPF